MTAPQAVRIQPAEGERRGRNGQTGGGQAPPGNAAAPAGNGGGAENLSGGRFDPESTSDDAELAVIGSLLAPPPLEVLRAAVARLKPSDFGNVRCRFLFGVVCRMAVDGIEPDLVSLPGYVRQHAIELPTLLTRHLATACHEIASAAPVPASLSFYIDLVLAESARRRLDAAGRRLCEIAAGGDAETVARCLDAVAAVTS